MAVRGFWAGLLIGGVVGAGVTLLVMKAPWRGSGEDTSEIAAPDAGPKAKSTKKKGKRKRRRTPKGGQSEVPVDSLVVLGAKDRALIWKGQAVRLPPRDVDFASGEGGRPLNQSEINAGVRSGSGAIVDCIGRSRGNAELSATITLKMLIGPDGAVKARRVQAPRYLIGNGLYSCVSKATSRLRFNATGAHTVVSLPLNLD